MAAATDIRAAYVQLIVTVAPANPSPCAAPGHCDFGKAFFGVVKPIPEPGALLFVGDCKWTKQGVSHRQTASAGSSFVQTFTHASFFSCFSQFCPYFREPPTQVASQREIGGAAEKPLCMGHEII